MAAPKRLHHSLLTSEKDSFTSTNPLIETVLTPSTSISPTTEDHLNTSNHNESSQMNQLINLQRKTFHYEQRDESYHRKSQLIQNQFENISKPTTKNKFTNINVIKTIDEDDWVCPVAVALRRAGYDVPLRPSKSWLERDRKNQALLRERQISSKEV